MKTAKLRSARRKRLINNTAVHVVLAVLAFIWGISDFMGNPDKLPRRERFICVDFPAAGHLH